MIEIQELEINCLSDYDLLPDKIGRVILNSKRKVFDISEQSIDISKKIDELSNLYIGKTEIDELKDRIGNKINSIFVEYPYIDFDYTSLYSSYHSKKHKYSIKYCVRLHFFKKSENLNFIYHGFIILRPSFISKRGRSYLDPLILINNEIYLMRTSYKANLKGNELVIKCFPWMSQETDISVCAHISAWSIIRYFSQKSNYDEKSIYDIVEMTPQYIDRKIPSKGLNILQLSEILTKEKHHPLVIKKLKSDDKSFLQKVYFFIESGIPVIGIMTKQEHAVTIIGHGKIDYLKYKNTNKITFTSDFINTLIVNDDNYLPYISVRYSTTKKSSPHKYYLDDFDFIIVPMYEKMLLNIDVVIEKFKILFKEMQKIENPIIRIYMTSSKSFKQKTKNDSNINTELKEIYLRLPMPKFIWCIEVTSFEEYKNSKVISKVIIDSTAGNFDSNPWLIIQDIDKVKYYDSINNNWLEKKDFTNMGSYDMFINNLERINKK